MAISARDFEHIKNNLPKVSISGCIDEDQKRRTGLTYLVIDLLKRNPYYFSWGVAYPTVEALAMAQDGVIDYTAGPTHALEMIHRLLEDVMFLPSGYADWRILNMLDTAGFKVLRDFNNPDDDAYWIRTIRGHFVIYPPEVV